MKQIKQDPPFKMKIENEIEQFRYDTWATKEPETISWIDSFKGDLVFFDIGANIGIYSLYCAARHPGCQIVVFEPGWENYFHLLDNMALNEFQFHAFRWAISSRWGKKRFYYESEVAGSSGGQIDKIIKRGKFIETYVISIDDIVEQRTNLIMRHNIGIPTHIKIDIDGQEWSVVQGMKDTLKRPELKSVLIEINENRDQIVKAFLDNGFTTDNIFNSMTPHSRERRAAEGITAENVIFTWR